MKKFLTAMVAGATLFSAGAAFAANQVQVTLTSPTIVKSGCEKAGAVTFAFDQNSNIKAGDWWYMDLPLNVTLCKSYDYVIGGGAFTGAGVTLNTVTGIISGAADALVLPVVIDQTGPIGATSPTVPPLAAATSVATLSPWISDAGADGIVTAVTEIVDGKWTDADADGVVDLGEIGAPYWADANTDGIINVAELVAPYALLLDVNADATIDSGDTLTGGSMAFRVVGTAGSRRITIYPLGTTTGDYFTVLPDVKFNIKIMDGKAYNVAGATTSMIMTDTDVEAVTTNKIYGEMISATNHEVISASSTIPATEPAVQNTLCIDASTYGGELVFVSFASKYDKFTFTGDSQIAHIGASMSINLVNCKGATSGQILIGGQNSCTFKYETAAGYCPTFGGNRLAIQSNSASFGDLGDSYSITAESMTDGVYFGSNALTLKGYTQVQSANGAWCSATATAITPAGGVVGYVGSTVATAYPDSSCSIPAAKKVAKLVTGAGSFLMNDLNTLETTLPSFVYDKTVIASGVEAKVRLTLDKAPCGTIFTGTHTVGTFVTSCTAAAGTTSLMFPFFPPMDPSAAPGWWGGYVIVNGGSSSGTAVLTYTDAAGATATYTTAAIAAGAQFNGSGLTSADLTAGTGTFSTTTNYSIKAACNFSMAAGFAFVSSPEAAASYVAYTNSGWQ